LARRNSQVNEPPACTALGAQDRERAGVEAELCAAGAGRLSAVLIPSGWLMLEATGVGVVEGTVLKTTSTQ